MALSSRAIARALLLLLASILVVTAVGGSAARAQTDPTSEPASEDGTADVSVDILTITGLLDPSAAAAITDVIGTAEARGSSLVVVQLSTPGAVSIDPAELVARIRSAEVPVAVFAGPSFVDAQVAGAGAAVYLAGHIKVMSGDATLGPIRPLVLGRDAQPEDQAVLDALVHEIDGAEVADLERELTVEEADALGLVDLPDVDGLTDLLTELDGRNVSLVTGDQTLRLRQDEVSVRFHSLGLVRRTLHAIATPTLVYLALAFALSLLLFELFQPGFGVAGIAGLVLLPLALYGLWILPVTWWAAALLILGFGLLAADVAIAGLGPPTIGGTAAILVGSLYLYPRISDVLALPTWLAIVVTLSALVFFVVIMTIILRAQAGPDTSAIAELVGRRGVVRSALNPEGHVYIDEALWRARWDAADDLGADTEVPAGKVKVGTQVEVSGTDGAVLLVRAASAATATSPAGTSETEPGSST